jgi:hypothetical protein
MIKWAERMKMAETKALAKVKEPFTEDDIEMSQLWTTDPLSEVFGLVEFKDNDIRRGPKDIYLILDGIFFTKGMENQDYGLVKACYESIMKRVKKLNEG